MSKFELRRSHANGTPGEMRKLTLMAVRTLKHGKCMTRATATSRRNPENLLVAERTCDALCEEARRMVQPKIEPTRSAGHTYIWSLKRSRRAGGGPCCWSRRFTGTSWRG